MMSTSPSAGRTTAGRSPAAPDTAPRFALGWAALVYALATLALGWQALAPDTGARTVQLAAGSWQLAAAGRRVASAVQGRQGKD